MKVTLPYTHVVNCGIWAKNILTVEWQVLVRYKKWSYSVDHSVLLVKVAFPMPPSGLQRGLLQGFVSVCVHIHGSCLSSSTCSNFCDVLEFSMFYLTVYHVFLQNFTGAFVQCCGHMKCFIHVCIVWWFSYTYSLFHLSWALKKRE